MLDRANRMPVIAQRRVVAGLSDVLQPRGDRRTIRQRGKNDPGVWQRRMEYQSGLEPRMKPLPRYHQ